MADEEVFAPLLAHGTADLVIAFEPGEAARVLPFLAPNGVLVTATTPIQPVTAALSSVPYRADRVVQRLETQLAGTAGLLRGRGRRGARPDGRAAGRCSTRCSLPARSRLAMSRSTWTTCGMLIEVCVKPAFVQLNLAAIEAVVAS